MTKWTAIVLGSSRHKLSSKDNLVNIFFFPCTCQEPLNSGDDVSDAEGNELFDTDNVVVCQYDKVRHQPSFWNAPTVWPVFQSDTFVSVVPRFTGVRTSGSSTWRTASWTSTGGTTSSPKPSGTPSGEVTQQREVLAKTSVSGNSCRVWENSEPNPKDCEEPLQEKQQNTKKQPELVGATLWRPWVTLGGQRVC